MDIARISSGKNPPEELNVVIEITRGGGPVKYEFDKESGALLVDRFMSSSMRYPANYGFIPHTLGGDGDPLDVLLICDEPLLEGSVVRARPVGVLPMEDESGSDEKLLMIPVDKVSPAQKHIKEHTDVCSLLRSQIEHFFLRYKDLEPGKWVKIGEWQGADAAKKLILEGIERVKR